MEIPRFALYKVHRAAIDLSITLFNTQQLLQNIDIYIYDLINNVCQFSRQFSLPGRQFLLDVNYEEETRTD